MAFGVEEWSDQADAFGVYFNLISRLSALVRDEDGVLWLRRPLSGITDLQIGSGTVAHDLHPHRHHDLRRLLKRRHLAHQRADLQGCFSDLGLSANPCHELAYSLGLIFCILLIVAVYRLGILGVRGVSDRYDSRQLTDLFAHTLIPISFAYVLAHYFSFLIWQSQAMGYLISDPLGNGANIFGTSGYQIDYHIISYAAIWYVQVAALIAGHVGGLMLAHDRALVIYRSPGKRFAASTGCSL